MCVVSGSWVHQSVHAPAGGPQRSLKEEDKGQ
jgi:hypothetical protein